MPDLDRVVAGLRCRDLLSRLPDFVGGNLNATEMEGLLRHLSGCVHCEKFGGEYGALVESLKSHATPPIVKADVRARLTQRMEEVWTRGG